MRRRIALPIAAMLLATFFLSHETTARSPQDDKGDQKAAKAQLYASQAALFSALAHGAGSGANYRRENSRRLQPRPDTDQHGEPEHPGCQFRIGGHGPGAA